MFQVWYDVLRDYTRSSNRLLSFFLVTFVPLRLDCDRVTLTAVRFACEHGLHVDSTDDGVDGRCRMVVRCFDCGRVAYDSVLSFCREANALRLRCSSSSSPTRRSRRGPAAAGA